MAQQQQTSRNNKIALVFFGFALVVAGAAIYGIVTILNQYRGASLKAEQPIENVTVVAASRTLYQGVEIRHDALFVSSVPPEYLPRTKDAATGAEVKAEVFRTRERVVGQVPRERILKNELIRPERLADGHAKLEIKFHAKLIY